jgi:hypothetical protein
MISSAIKTLSGNDLGLTMSHQAGFLIPKVFIREGLFESLPNTEKNPRRHLQFMDLDIDSTFIVNFIFYNNKLFQGTRLEYRLTGLTRWLKDKGLRVGDSIEIARISRVDYTIKAIRAPRQAKKLSEESWTAIYGKAK